MYFQQLLTDACLSDGNSHDAPKRSLSVAPGESSSQPPRSFRLVWFFLSLSAALLAVAIATQSVAAYFACFGAFAVSSAVDWLGARP